MIIPFDFAGSKVRVAGSADAPLFVAADVCAVLGIEKYRDAIHRLDADERGSVLVDTLGGGQQMAAVTESGLYHLIFKSRKPSAKKFRRWVTDEVLPEIRKTGAYRRPPTYGELARMVLDQERKMEVAGDLMDKLMPAHPYGSIASNGAPRLGFRRAAWVAAANRLHDAGRIMAAAAQLELDMILVEGGQP